MSNSVAVVIVTHNSAAEAGECLAALRKHAWKLDGTGAVTEVIVVDNASTDGSADIVEARAPLARIIRNRMNRGFAAAVNQGVRASSSPLVLLLNPDAVLETSLHDLVRAFDSPDVAAAGGSLRGTSGEWQRGFNVRSFPTPSVLVLEALLANRVWPGNPVNRRYRMLDLEPQREQDVDQPAGAFLMFRRKTWEELGGLDEAFHPLWFEDVDFCLRIRQAGGRIRYIPGSVARHSGGHSVKAASLQFRQHAWYGGLLQFCKKHFSAGAYRGLQSAVAVGLCMRWLACWWGTGDRNERKAYGSVLKMVMGSQAVRSVSAQAGPAPIAES
jgi:GT2 family glycosyltransferase